MQTETITPAEAWAAVERLKIGVIPHSTKAEWYATVLRPIVTVGSGPTPVEAIADLLKWLGRKVEARTILSSAPFSKGLAMLEDEAALAEMAKMQTSTGASDGDSRALQARG